MDSEPGAADPPSPEKVSEIEKVRLELAS